MIRAKTDFADVLVGVRLAFWLIIALTACALYAAYGVGQTMRAIGQNQTARVIAEEDHAFCEKFGMRASGDYARCCQELAIIRRSQADRDRRNAEGLL